MILKINGLATESMYEWLNDDSRWHQPVADPEFIREYYGSPQHHLTVQQMLEDMRQADYVAHIQPGAPGSAEYTYYMSDQASASVADPIVHFEQHVASFFNQLTTGFHTIIQNGHYDIHAIMGVLLNGNLLRCL